MEQRVKHTNRLTNVRKPDEWVHVELLILLPQATYWRSELRWLKTVPIFSSFN